MNGRKERKKGRRKSSWKKERNKGKKEKINPFLENEVEN